MWRSVGPLIALIALNSRLAVELRKVDRRRTQLRGRSTILAATTTGGRQRGGGTKQQQQQQQHENLTAMLVGVVTVFIICQLPGVGVRVANTVLEFAKVSSTDIPVGIDLITLRYANIACNMLLVFNSAVNIVVYCLVGKRFRRILLDEMFGSSCCSCCRSTSTVNSPRTPTTMIGDTTHHNITAHGTGGTRSNLG